MTSASFPESIFPLCKNHKNFEKALSVGKEYCKDKNILFCGIAKNVAKTLELNLKRVEKTAKLFNDFDIFIYENNSSDSTVEILENAKDYLTYVSEFKTDRLPDLDENQYYRCEALAECRNKYVRWINTNRDKYEYVCVIDWDIKGGWSYDGFYHSMSILKNETVGCVTSYGVLSDFYQVQKLEENDPSKYLMYDSFAYRGIEDNEKLNKKRQASFNFMNFKRGDKFFPVRSNFNGLGIYKTSCFDDNTYKTNNIDAECADSEHVAFHDKIIESGLQVIMNPNLIVSYSHHKYSGEENE